MKLKDVKELTSGQPFNIHNNRFVLFDKNGNQLNCWAVEDTIPDYPELEVIETTESGYNNSQYFIGYPTTHIKLNIKANDETLHPFSSIKYGEVEEE